MRALLDTHALIWHIEGSSKLGSQAKQAIESTENSVFFSIASIWEMSIKIGLNKLILENPFSELEDLLRHLKIEILPISFADAEQYLALPLYHRDPFDRMLIAQAITTSSVIVSADTAFDAYSIQRVWA